MSPVIEAKATSPISNEDKVQDGRVQKPKSKKSGLTPTYRIDGRTFACEGCKNGHRVSKCTHAGQRPVLMTNDPGRPSADQKRHCDCPKTCECTKKSCKCPRNCICVQTMYMLVYVPVGEEKVDPEAREGEWKIEREVITDLKGKVLSTEEIYVRQQEKMRQQSTTGRTGTAGAVSDRSTSQGSTSPFDTPVSIKAETLASPSSTIPKSSCCHKKNIQEQQPLQQVKNEIPVPVRTTGRPLGSCDCGPNCLCEFCLDHPNNPSSQRIAHQRATQYFSPYLPGSTLGQNGFTPPAQKGLSCMGTKPRFAFHPNPYPSEAEFQAIFGQDATTNLGYCLSYDVGGYSSGSAAPLGSSSASTMLANHAGFSSNEGPSQFMPLANSNTDMLSKMHPQPKQDFMMAPGFLPQEIASQTQPSNSFDIGSDMLQTDNYVGQATIAGIYGMSSDWLDFGAHQPATEQWLPASSDIEKGYITPGPAPDFKTNAAPFTSMALPGTVNPFNPMSTMIDHPSTPQTKVNHFNPTSTMIDHPSTPQTNGHGDSHNFPTHHQYQPLHPDLPGDTNHTNPVNATSDTYTPDMFHLPLLADDPFSDIPLTNPGYVSPDFGMAQIFPT